VTTAEAAPAVDPADPTPWLESKRRSRRRRLASMRATARRRMRQRGTLAVVAAMTVGAAGAAAQQHGATPAAAPAALLQVGSSGAGVQALQRALGVTSDGIYGPATRRAVRAYQRAHGLELDGIAGPATLASLGLASAAAAAAPLPVLQRIAQCESSGNPAAVSADGVYRGKYQFSMETWRELGGSGDPAHAPEAEQDARAAVLYAREGSAPWPVCG
jgi:peptidoglycan hydrolase-like protein with peptidoglycan-binding domain